MNKNMIMLAVVGFTVGRLWGVDVMTSGPGTISWTIVHSRTVSLSVDWPAEAVSAKLQTFDASGKLLREQIIPFGADSIDWVAFYGDAPNADALYTASLTFLGGDSSEVGTHTSQLAVLRGAFNAGLSIATDETGKDWRKANPNGFLVGYDSAWIGGTGPCVLTPKQGATELFSVVNPAASGWTWLRARKPEWPNKDPFTLEMSCSGTDSILSADLEFMTMGCILSIK